jgi:hypothetical protein
MHCSLRVDEILRLIACELITAGGQASAVALACCCKGFENPVLDPLWKTQDQLDPLLRTLPEDIWNPSSYDVSVVITILILSLLNYLIRKSLTRPPTKKEWDRLMKYAKKMERLSMSGPLPSQVLSVLKFRAFGNPLLPNSKTLELWNVCGDCIPFIPLFLSVRTKTISLTFLELDLHKVMAASLIVTFPTLCPNLNHIRLIPLPRDPMITVAVSELVLTTNRDTLRSFHVDSPLTEEAREVIYKIPLLRELRTVIDGPTSLPTMILQNLTDIRIEYHPSHDWLQGFRGASLGKLSLIRISSESDSIDNFLRAFETVVLTTSIPATLSTFGLRTKRAWRPAYRSLLPFTQLTTLVIESSCEPVCSSTIDDDTVTDLAQAMPKLQVLQLGDLPCEAPTGVTVKGLAALAHYCPHLSRLRIHFQVASLDPPEIPSPVSADKSTVPQVGCALRSLQAGYTRMPKESVLMVTLTLLTLFPRLERIFFSNGGWKEVVSAIHNSKKLVRCSSKIFLFVAPRSNIDGTSPGPRVKLESDF